MACSYCYADGHNRRSCSKLTQRLEQHASEGNAYAETMLKSRGKGTGHKKATRRCSFCRTRGHDRRGCNHANAYIDKVANRMLAVRAKFYDKMVENAFGVGSLVAFKEYDYSLGHRRDMTRTGLVRAIRWDEIGPRSVNSAHQLVQVSFFRPQEESTAGETKEHIKYVPLPERISMWSHDTDGTKLNEIADTDHRRVRGTKILSPSSGPSRNESHTLKSCKKAAKESIAELGVDVYTTRFRKLFTRDEILVMSDQNEKERQQ